MRCSNLPYFQAVSTTIYVESWTVPPQTQVGDSIFSHFFTVTGGE